MGKLNLPIYEETHHGPLLLHYDWTSMSTHVRPSRGRSPVSAPKPASNLAPHQRHWTGHGHDAD